MTCPEGHESTATDYCDVCGAVMGAAAPEAANAAPPAPEAPAAPEGGAGGDHDAKECPNCGAPGLPDALFCEACGYDYTTGTMPRPVNALDLDAPAPSDGNPLGTPDSSGPVAAAGEPLDPDSGATMLRSALPAESVVPADEAAEAAVAATPEDPVEGAPAPPTAPASSAPTLTEPWLAEVWIDPAWYRDQGSPDPMPSPGPPDLVVITTSSVLVGRESTSRGITPDIDCGVDNGVSRRHAQLTTDGTRWWVEDLDSANGVWIGDVVGELPRTPIPARSKREFSADDRLYVGSWTRIVVRRATQDEIDALA